MDVHISFQSFLVYSTLLHCCTYRRESKRRERETATETQRDKERHTDIETHRKTGIETEIQQERHREALSDTGIFFF